MSGNGRKRPLAIKVYLVFQRMNLVDHGDLNSRIVGTKLTREAAQDVVDRTPGTWIEKHLATK